MNESGLPGLDSMLDSIRMGDNVVWQVSSMDDYMHFVTPLCNQLHEEGKELLYMHFSGHPALLQVGNGIRVYEFDPSEGFEAFTMNVRRRIKAEGRDAFYVIHPYAGILWTASDHRPFQQSSGRCVR